MQPVTQLYASNTLGLRENCKKGSYLRALPGVRNMAHWCPWQSITLPGARLPSTQVLQQSCMRGSALHHLSLCTRHLQAGVHMQRLYSLPSLGGKPLCSGRPLLHGGDPADRCIGQPHRWLTCWGGLCPQHRLQLEDCPRILPHQVCAWRYGTRWQGCREPPDGTACGDAGKVWEVTA